MSLLDAIRAAGYLVAREDGQALTSADVVRLEKIAGRFERDRRAAKTEAPRETP